MNERKKRDFAENATAVVLVMGCVLMVPAAIEIKSVRFGGRRYAPISQPRILADPKDILHLKIAYAVFACGATLAFLAMGYGLLVTLLDRRGLRQARRAKVISKYAYARDGRMLTEEWQVEAADKPKLCVSLDFGPENGHIECECSVQVFCRCGEGMTGMAETHGKWLGSFVPDGGTGL
jgi:hypothetical protein